MKNRNSFQLLLGWPLLLLIFFIVTLMSCLNSTKAKVYEENQQVKQEIAFVYARIDSINAKIEDLQYKMVYGVTGLTEAQRQQKEALAHIADSVYMDCLGQRERLKTRLFVLRLQSDSLNNLLAKY